MAKFNVQALANTAWAFATANQHDASLFATLGAAAEQRMGELKPQNIANTAWAFATVGQKQASLFVALAKVAEW